MPRKKKILDETKDIQAGIEKWNNSLSPLDYMLSIMRDPNATQTRRDRMAMAAAPYCHAKVIMAQPGKKDQQIEAALTAGTGTSWADDLGEIRAQ